MPGAYVSLPSQSLDLLSTSKQFRIILAGIWNNLLLCLVIWSMTKSGVASSVHGGTLRALGYQDWNERGVMVQLIRDPVRSIFTSMAL